MNRRFKGLGGFETRMPTIEELTALWRNKGEPDALKKFAKAVVLSPTLAQIRKEYPSAVVNIVDAVLEVYGAMHFKGEDLDEDELDELGEDFVRIYVAEKEKSARLGKVDDLLVVRVCFSNPALSPALAFILRKPREVEVDDYSRDANSFHLARALVKKLCVHGPLDEIETKFPGLWMGLASRAVMKAGIEQDIELDLA